MPDFQHNDFALFEGQFGQSPLGRFFEVVFTFSRFEPARRFQFARDPPPEAALEIQRAIAESTDAIMLWIIRGFLQLQQRDKSFLQNIFRLAFPKTQGAAVQ